MVWEGRHREMPPYPDSPTLSNIFLHHVLDDWFEHEAKPRLRGRCQLVRYADDIVLAFEDRRSAERLLDVLGKRLGRYGLELHETKTRLVDFRPNCPRGHDHETVFDFLGFAHIWGTSRRGNRVVRQITAKSRLARAVKTVYEWCTRRITGTNRCRTSRRISPKPYEATAPITA